MIGSYSTRPNIAYRVLRMLFILVGRLLFRVRATGLEFLPVGSDGRPTGGWICCGLPHRNWVEPFLMMSLLPAEPRPVILADGRTATGSWWRRLLVRVTGGGVIPIRGRGEARDFEAYAEEAKRVISAGAVFVIFAEVGPPSRPSALRRLSASVAHFAMATGAMTVPVVFGGTHELYLRRRIEVRVLPALDPPGAGVESLDAWMVELRQKAEESSAEAHVAAEARAPRRKVWRWLTGPYPRAEDD